MAYPDIYDVTYSYMNFQLGQGDNSFPGTQLDADLAGISDSLENLSDFAKNVIRSDGKLNNSIVTFDSLSPSLQTAGLAPATAWATGVAYAMNAAVMENSALYRATVAHTAGAFATDLAAVKWVFVVELPRGADGTNGTDGYDYETVSTASAATVPETQNVVRVAGYTTAGDQGAGVYVRAVSEPDHEGKFQDASGAWFELVPDRVTPAMFGAVGAKADGTVDAVAEVTAADAYCQAKGVPLYLAGGYRLSSDLEIVSRVIALCGELMLDSGVKLNLPGGVEAGDRQIFKYADRTCRAWTRNTEFRAYWWGVRMDAVGSPGEKKDNNVELQYALDSVAGSNYDAGYANNWEGGTIMLPAGYCYMQAGVVMHGFQTIRGTSRSAIFAPDEVGWTGVTNYLFKMYKERLGAATVTIASPGVVSSAAHGLVAGDKVYFTTTGALPTGIVSETEYYVISAGLTADAFELSATSGGSAINTSGTQSGTHTWHKGMSQFNTRLENCRIRGNGFAGVIHQVLAWSPNEQCGCDNVHFDSIYKYGVTYQRGYGGSVVWQMDQCELWLAVGCSVTARCVNINMEGSTTVGWMNIALNHITVSGSVVPVSGTDEWIGIYADGRVVVDVQDQFAAEYIVYGIFLDTTACLRGGGIQGNVGSINVIAINSTWDNTIAFVDVSARRGNTTTLFKDFKKGYLLYATDPPDGRILYPPDPNGAIGSIAVDSADGTNITWSRGNISTIVTKPGTGRYAFTLASALSAVNDYRVRVDFEYPSGASYPLTPIVLRNSSSDFEVQFRDAAGALTDVTQFQVHVLHRP